jgi:hypothetical protein
MAKVVTPVTCKVILISKPKQSSYGEGQTYHAVLFADQAYPEGVEEAKIWKNLTPDEVIQLQKGDIVQLVPAGTDKNGKPKHQIVTLTPAASRYEQAVIDHQTRTLKPKGWSDDEKRMIAAKVSEHAKLMRFCLEMARSQFGDLLETEESLRCAATTLFLQALK